MSPVMRACRPRLWPGLFRAYSSSHGPSPSPSPSSPPLRMAVIGSGPAGFYTAYRVMGKIPAHVNMYEALPVPYGLVRFGVAPDHPEVKNCQEKFEEVAQSPGFRFLGNVSVGSTTTKSIPLDVLARHYDAVVFAYGAARDRLLGVPGEQLRGVYAARDFVGWYNGQPNDSLAAADSTLAADLAAADTAVVIGQGNVALDVARMLLADVDTLRRTDISEAAVDALARCRVRRVHVVGRRGPVQAAFTIKELRELMRLPGVAMHPVDGALLPPNLKDLPRAQRRLLEVVAKGAPTPTDEARKAWSLDFCLAPVRFAGTAQVTTATFARTRLADPFDRNSPVAAHTGEHVDLPASLVFRSVGYRAEPLAGFDELAILFDERRGCILNDGYGRVLREVRADDATIERQPNPGFYCAGWVKRGPTGVIASTMEDAFLTADAIVQDWQARAPFLHADQSAWDGVCSEVDTSGSRVVSWQDWQRIDRAEIERGRALGKPRSKLTRTADMLAVLS